MYNYDALIVRWNNGSVTIAANSQRGREYFDLQGWGKLHEISDEHPEDFMPPLLEEGLVIAMKLENSERMNFVEKVPPPSQTN